MSAGSFEGLPRVPISVFKANPARYEGTGALVTSHGRVRAAFVPVDDGSAADGVDVESIKAQLLLLSRIRNNEVVARELEELAASRDRDRVPEPR